MQATSTKRLLSKLRGAIFWSKRKASTASTVATKACRRCHVLEEGVEKQVRLVAKELHKIAYVRNISSKNS